jgi:hypothetical protein
MVIFDYYIMKVNRSLEIFNLEFATMSDGRMGAPANEQPGTRAGQ